MTDLLTTGETAEAAPAPASVAVPRGDIAYVVLTSSGDNLWTVAPLVEAKSPAEAIEKHIGDGDPEKLRFVAVAARYWSPTSYGVEVETTRKLVPKAAK